MYGIRTKNDVTRAKIWFCNGSVNGWQDPFEFEIVIVEIELWKVVLGMANENKKDIFAFSSL